MKIGVIGVGGIGAVRVAALAKAPGLELGAVHDPDAARAKSVAPKARQHSTADRMYDDPSIEGVVISTPPQFHEELCIRALEAGKHVLVEKPMASSPGACRRMVAKAQRTGRTLAVGFNHRYFPAIKVMRDVARSGEIGTLTHVKAYSGHTGLSEFKAPWMYDKAVMGGGAMMDNGIHIVDLVRYVMGDITEVIGHTSNRTWQLDGAEDNATAIFKTADGVFATFQASWTEWKGYRFHVEAYGDRGMTRAYYAPMQSLVITMDGPGQNPRTKRTYYPRNIVREKLFGWQDTVITAFAEEMLDFAAASRGAIGSGRLATGWDGQRAIEVAHAVYESCSAGRATKPGQTS